MMFGKSEETEVKRHDMNPEFRVLALLFAISGIAPVMLVTLGLINAVTLPWVYLAVFCTVVASRRVKRK